MTLKQSFETAVTDVVQLSATLLDTEIGGGQTEFDNSSNLWLDAVAVINVPDSFSATPAGPINLLMVRSEIDGTADGTAFGYVALTTTNNQTDPEYAEFVGSWFPNVAEAYRDHINISLEGVKKCKFYIQNQTGVDLTYSASNITVDIIPVSKADV